MGILFKRILVFLLLLDKCFKAISIKAIDKTINKNLV